MSEASNVAHAQGPGKPLSEAIPDVTPEECANLHKAFDQIDFNHDGKVFHVLHGAAVCLFAQTQHTGLTCTLAPGLDACLEMVFNQ
jgi:hypothetical protein